MTKLSHVQQIVESLGLSRYEAKAYTALMKEFPVTGYHLSKISGVPRSRIYETLEKLGSKGFILREEGKPARYIPIAGEELILKTERSLHSRLSVLREWFATLDPGVQRITGTWNLEGRDNILAKAVSMIQDAENVITLSGWADDLRELQPELKNAAERNVPIIVTAVGAFTADFTENIYQHRWEREQKISAQNIALVVDRSSALIGSTTPDKLCAAAWTENPGVVKISRDYILHQVVINRLLNYIPPGIQRELMAFYDIKINR